MKNVLPKYLSASAMDQYDQCPRRYFYSRVQKLEEPPVGDAARIGTVIHSVFEKLYSLNNTDRGLKQTDEIIEQEWAAYKASDEYMFVDLSDQEFVDKIRLACSNLFATETPSKLNVLHVEYKFSTEIDGVPVYGFVDRVIEESDGSIRVDDFKSGKQPDVKYEYQKLRQPFLYAAALNNFGIVADSVSLTYILAGGVVSRPVTQASLGRIKKRVVQTWSDIQDEKFPCKTGPLCAYCPFENICVTGQCAARVYRQKRIDMGNPIV